MERIGFHELGGVGVGRGAGDIHLLGIPDGLCVFIGDDLDGLFVGQAFKQPSAKDVIQLIPEGVDRLDAEAERLVSPWRLFKALLICCVPP